MTLALRDEDGVAAEPLRVEINDADGNPVPVKIVQVRDAAGVAKTVWESISAVASPDFQRVYGNDPSPLDITSNEVSVEVAGGVAPYTYLWTRTDAADGDTWAIADDAAATTTFTCENADIGKHGATFVCTVIDDSGASVVSNEITVAAVNLGGGL